MILISRPGLSRRRADYAQDWALYVTSDERGANSGAGSVRPRGRRAPRQRCPGGEAARGPFGTSGRTSDGWSTWSTNPVRVISPGRAGRTLDIAVMTAAAGQIRADRGVGYGHSFLVPFSQVFGRP
jgi:hypothetical protein